MARRRSDPNQEALEELYSVEPAEFVELRKALTKRIRDEAGREAADLIAAQRKPTTPAWAVNQLVRRHESDVRELVRSGSQLRKLQQSMIAGGSAEGVDEAVQELRRHVSRLTTIAAELISESGGSVSEVTKERISETLLAAVADEERSRELEQGRLTTEWQSAGFGFGAATGVATKRRPGGKRRDERAAREKRLTRLRKARDKVAAARAELEERETERRRLETELKRAESAVGKAEERLQRAERALAKEDSS